MRRIVKVRRYGEEKTNGAENDGKKAKEREREGGGGTERERRGREGERERGGATRTHTVGDLEANKTNSM